MSFLGRIFIVGCSSALIFAKSRSVRVRNGIVRYGLTVDAGRSELDDVRHFSGDDSPGFADAKIREIIATNGLVDNEGLLYSQSEYIVTCTQFTLVISDHRICLLGRSAY
jgi:hypothetical protein